MISGYILSVTEVTRYIKALVDSDELLQSLWVRGEVSNFKHHPSGHMYFTLKDEGSCLRCVMFRSRNEALGFRPANGMKVLVAGYVSVFERDGQYQLYVEEMRLDGLGSLHLAFEQLKQKLAAEGLFDLARKRPIPLFPRKIGIITSLAGAALRDIITVARRRFPGVRMVIAPVVVQGDEAPAQIVRALQMMNRLPEVDVIIVGRGGGSLEELWAFNDERVARSIFASRIPVVSAVGHETDYTIADYVADLRAPTPSAAAERVVPDKAELVRHLNSMNARLQMALRSVWQRWHNRLQVLQRDALLRHPERRINQRTQILDQMAKRLSECMQARIILHKARGEVLAGKLEALNPLAILRRGYSVCRKLPEGNLVRKARDVQKRELIEVLLGEGRIECDVRRIEEGYDWLAYPE